MNDGGPAYPLPCAYHPGRERVADVSEETGQSGMSLRDWFAGQALAGITANGKWGNHKSFPSGPYSASVAAWAYEYADAMLSEREKAKP